VNPVKDTMVTRVPSVNQCPDSSAVKSFCIDVKAYYIKIGLLYYRFYVHVLLYQLLEQVDAFGVFLSERGVISSICLAVRKVS